MKKPNITKGEWRYNPNSKSSDWGHNWGVVAWQRNLGSVVSHVIFKEKDAQAISAVPDMIDALIEARKELITVQQIYQYSTVVQGCIEQIDEALKKAGCTNE